MPPVQSIPYNCSRPGNAFVGYETLRAELIEDLVNGKSFAILGGRRCGKTSLLLQLQKDLEKRPEFQPRFIDFQALGTVTPAHIFNAFLQLIAPPDFVPSRCPQGNEYAWFLSQLENLRTGLEKRMGSDWIVVL